MRLKMMILRAVLVMLSASVLTSMVKALPIAVASENDSILKEETAVSVHWDHYHNYTEITEVLLELNATNPDIIDVFSIGRSWQNRTIYCVRLTNETHLGSKHQVLFVGYHHAREPITAEVPLYFVVDTLAKFGVNPAVTSMLNYSEVYVIVALNVDGFDLFKVNDFQRKNARPTDEDGDGLLDEDPPEDEDGDGFVEQLLQWTGSYWTFLKWEGIDSDGDGLSNEDWIGGVDLNRNYGYMWNASADSGSTNPNAEDYKGPAAFSEPETQALRNLALTHDFKYALSFHSGSEVVLYPWGYTSHQTSDNSVFTQIAANLSALTGAPYRQSAQMYTTSGVWDDWMYGNRSTLALTLEIFSNASEWVWESGPYPNSYWRRGLRYVFNPRPQHILSTIQRWLPVFGYITSRAISTPHNLAVLDAVACKSIVGEGYLQYFNVTISNSGEHSETFNASVYANMTYAASHQVTVRGRSTSTFTISWNTSGFARGYYEISVYAGPVLGETNTADNSKIVGSLTQVTRAGDVDGDSDVDIYDVVSVCGAYGSKKGDLQFNPNFDINGDWKIDIYDVVIACAHYGEKSTPP